AEDEEQRRAGEARAVPLPHLHQHAPEVRARVEVEWPARRDVPVLDRDRTEAVDVGEEVHAAEVVGGGRDQPEQQLARGRDRAGEVAERDQVGPPGPSRPEAGPDGHTGGRHRAANGPAEVQAPAACPVLASREPAPQAPAQLADQLACLLDVARGEVAEREREEPAGACGAALVARALPGVPRLGARGWLAAVAVHRPLAVRPPLVAGPRPPAVPGPASGSRRHRTAAGAAHAAARAPPLGTPDQRERLVEKPV